MKGHEVDGLVEVVREAARVAIQSLRVEHFLGTVEVGEVAWDVYVRPLPPHALDRVRSATGRTFEDSITIAVRIESPGHVECGFFAPGRLTLAEVSRDLHEAQA